MFLDYCKLFQEFENYACWDKKPFVIICMYVSAVFKCQTCILLMLMGEGYA